jgi:CheY-like chemotaxis protein
MPKLLVVDGSPMMHRIMELTFAPEGIQVLTASDGNHAIALLPVARPDVVSADHAAAGRNGYELSAFIKGHPDLGHVPVLLLASPFEPLDRARAEACGVAGEIAKPYEPAQLVARVRELLTPPPAVSQPELPVAGTEAEARPPALKLVEPQAPPARGALDDYFDRLDAALERLDEQIARAEGPGGGEPLALPTLDRLLSDERPAPRGAVLIDHPLRGAYGSPQGGSPDASRTGGAAEAEPDVRQESGPAEAGSLGDQESGAPAESHGRRESGAAGADLGSLVEALEALRRRAPASEGLPVHAAPDASGAPSDNPQGEARFSDATIDEITRRVLQRLAPGAIDRLLADVVRQVAEKVLREEIARLK